MRSLSKFIPIALLLGCAAFQVRADQTNVVQTVNVDLFGLRQGRTVTNGNMVITSAEQVRVGTDEIIRAIGTAIGNTFSRAAKLVLVTPIDGGLTSVEIRDTNGVTADVTGFFDQGQIGAAIESSTLNLRTGRFSSSEYSVRRLALHDSAGYPALNVHFDVSGVAVDSESNFGGDRVRSEVDSGVAGVGDRNGNFLVMQGWLRFLGRVVEVVTDELPPPA